MSNGIFAPFIANRECVTLLPEDDLGFINRRVTFIGLYDGSVHIECGTVKERSLILFKIASNHFHVNLLHLLLSINV